jgi:hypothetical protein
MSFRTRMMFETHAPQPRFLYLVEKIAETALIALVVWRCSPLSLLVSSLIAAVVYTAIGIGLWYQGGVRRWIGPGSFTGDVGYHLCPSLLVVALVYPDRAIAVALFVIVALVWWVLDTAGYGPERSAPGQPDIPTP